MAVPGVDKLLGRNVPKASLRSPQEIQEKLSRIVGDVLGRIDQPVLIILEDLQWAGSESIDLLTGLIPTVTDQDLMVAGTFRDERPLPFLANLTQIEIFNLQRLTEQGIADFSVSMLGDAGRDPEVIELLERETEGNAFFLVEAARALAEEAGQLDRVNAMMLPETIKTGGIQAILERRLNRVPVDARPLLQLASTAARELDFDLLRLLEPKVDLDQWLTICANATVLEAYGETCRFSHDKLREGIKDSLSHELHHELHHRVALGLEELYPDAPEQAAALAHHWSVAGNPERELHYAEIAGHQAAANNANLEAIRFFERALELLETLPQSQERDLRELSLLMALGPPVAIIRNYTDPEVNRIFGRAQELAIQAGQSDLLFQATRGRWVYYDQSGDFDTAQKFIDQLFLQANEVEDDDLLLEAHHAGWSTNFMRGNLATAEEHVLAGLKIYDPDVHHSHIHLHGHDPGVCASNNGAQVLWLLGYPDRARQRALKGLELATGFGHHFSTALARAGVMRVAHMRGDHQEASDRARELLSFAEENRFPMFIQSATLVMGVALVEEGKQDEGMALMADVLRMIQETGATALRPLLLTEYLLGCLASGAVDDGLGVAKEEIAAQPYSGQRIFESEIRRLYGELLLAKDETLTHKAERQLQLALDIARLQGARSLELRAAMSLARSKQKHGQSTRSAGTDYTRSIGWFSRGFETADLTDGPGLLSGTW